MQTLATYLTGAWQPAILFMLAAHLLVGAGLVARRTDNLAAHRMLALLLATLAGILLRQVFILTGLFEESAAWIFLPIANDLALGPLILSYVFLLTGARLPLPGAVLFAPAIVYIAYMTVLGLMPAGIKLDWYARVHAPLIIPAMTALSLPMAIAALAVSGRRQRRYRRWLEQTSSATAEFELRGLRLALLAITAPVAGWVGLLLLTLVLGPLSPQDEYPFYLMLALCGYGLAMVGLTQPRTEFPKLDAARPAPPAPGDAVGAEADNQKRLVEDLRARVRDAGWYAEPRLTLRELAARVGVPESTLSQALNKGGGVNFNRFINEMRVDAVKATLKAGEEDLLGAALDAGFNSKATFNRVFKDVAGETPSAFRARERPYLA